MSNNFLQVQARRKFHNSQEIFVFSLYLCGNFKNDLRYGIEQAQRSA
jgi:hypothetical protein